MGKVGARLSLSGAARIQDLCGFELDGGAACGMVPGKCRAGPRFCPASQSAQGPVDTVETRSSCRAISLCSTTGLYCVRMVWDCRRIGNILETSCKPRGARSGIGNFLETSGKLPHPDCPGRQMADTPSILSARLTRWRCDSKRHRVRPRVRHFLYVPLPVFAAVWWGCRTAD